ncbi:DUF4838 domain-containing protein [Sphingomonas sp. TREG-RG-20F-R18-01]|uniref:DUF4838 domain-containing protein n=1 Tax=Sphingomonas sp. TREG-RG-20F-R18-01 TaxID=2914982 RepID=UPI001F591AFF|nr:DUF4838 domain-containing protein [Sphingomonas sp. TREG-RG-20F-R18-01]
MMKQDAARSSSGSRGLLRRLAMMAAALVLPQPALAQLAGRHGADDLAITHDGTALAVIVVAPDAGPWEKRAGSDLQKYIGLMTGAMPQIVATLPAGAHDGAIVLGKAAVAADRRVAARLTATAKPHPLVQGDAIVALRAGNRLYLAGSNDESSYFAASWLLQQWGCRWYLPTAFGEVVPQHRDLSVGTLSFAYAPPFEIRHYWTAWNGSEDGAEEFRHRNFMSLARLPGNGQALDAYTTDIAPPGGTAFNVPFSAEATARHIVTQIAPSYRKGTSVSLAIADGRYQNDDPGDRALVTEYDRSMLRPSLTDAMMTLYNRVAATLRHDAPDSKALIGGLAYVNVTLPPRIVTKAEPNLAMWIAPIDIDPNHTIDDPRSPPRQAYGAMVDRWAKVMDGRLAIYDYDQGMLVWRDLPDPSQDVFARDVRHYAKLGILGIGTESRGAYATTFLNLFFRGQLMWDPNADVGAMLKDFYPAFYGPAAPAMADYWGAIFAAWRDTGVTEHEAMAAPAIYTPALVARLAPALDAAEAAFATARGTSAKGTTGRDADVIAQRLRFTRLSFEVIRNYVAMIDASATRGDYAAAVRAGEQALAARQQLATLSPIFTTHVVGVEAEKPDGGPAWFPGEVEQLRGLAALTDGRKGQLIAKLPLAWSFALRDPVPAGWRYTGEVGGAGPCRGGIAPEPAPRIVRSDLYLQGQGVLRPGGANDLGFYCEATQIDLAPADVARSLHLMLPGLFNEAWLYVDGKLVAHRGYPEPWWNGDYRRDWDVDLSGLVAAGGHTITIGGFNPVHFAGLFRRPFLYRPGAG